MTHKLDFRFNDSSDATFGSLFYNVNFTTGKNSVIWKVKGWLTAEIKRCGSQPAENLTKSTGVKLQRFKPAKLNFLWIQDATSLMDDYKEKCQRNSNSRTINKTEEGFDSKTMEKLL